MPSISFWRRSRVVAETASSSSGIRLSRMRSIEPLPAPEVPVTTTTGEALAPEEANELGPLPVRETSDRLRLADPRLGEKACRLHAPELGHRHEDVEDLGRGDVVRRLPEDLLDVCLAVLQVPLQLRPLDADVVCALQRLHALVAGPGRRLGLSLHGGHGAGY